MGHGQEAAFVMNRSSGCEAGLILTLEVGHPGYENVSEAHLDFFNRKGKGRKSTLCKMYDMTRHSYNPERVV